MIRRTLCLAAAILAAFCAPALAWGTTGHRIINQTAMQALPETVPAFLRTPDAIREVAALGPELDRLKGAGDPHDDDSDPGHYVDTVDDLTVAGTVHLDALPPSREAYDTALRAKHTDEYREGYLPYSMIDGWQQVSKDLAYWRADDYLALHGTTPEDRAWFAYDRGLREQLTLRDIGVWGHYVGDASQPLHVTVHYNGWGRYPNPRGYSTAHTVHANFESDYVRDHASADAVRALVGPDAIADSTTASIVKQIGAYLASSAREVVPLYDLEAKAAFSSAGTAQGTDFAQHRLAAGAQELRDLIVAAWDSSLTQSVAYPPVRVQDILSGKALPGAKAFGSD